MCIALLTPLLAPGVRGNSGDDAVGGLIRVADSDIRDDELFRDLLSLDCWLLLRSCGAGHRQRLTNNLGCNSWRGLFLLLDLRRQRQRLWQLGRKGRCGLWLGWGCGAPRRGRGSSSLRLLNLCLAPGRRSGLLRLGATKSRASRQRLEEGRANDPPGASRTETHVPLALSFTNMSVKHQIGRCVAPLGIRWMT